MNSRWIVIRSILWTWLFTLAIIQLVYGGRKWHQLNHGRAKSITELVEFINKDSGQHIDHHILSQVPNPVSKIYANQLLKHYNADDDVQQLWHRLNYEISPNDYYKYQSLDVQLLSKIDIAQNISISVFLMFTILNILRINSTGFGETS